MKRIVILGGGRITGALLAGLHRSSYKASIVVHDRNPGKLRRLQKLFGVGIEKDLRRAVDQAEILVIAVRPDSVSDLLRAIGPLKRKLHAVSLAAGIPIAKLRARLGPPVRWARAMPSPAFRTGRGLTAMTFDKGFSPSIQKTLTDLFQRGGPVLVIPESRFDAFTVTYSSSHGYHALASLAASAEKTGLDRKTALIAASHALADGILAWRESGIGLESLLHEAATPGGIAAAVMKAMDDSGYQRAVSRGLAAGIRRARANARKA